MGRKKNWTPTPLERLKQSRISRGLEEEPAKRMSTKKAKKLFVYPDYAKHIEEQKNLTWGRRAWKGGTITFTGSDLKPGDIFFKPLTPHDFKWASEDTVSGHEHVEKKPEKPAEEFVDKWIKENT